MLSNKIKAVFLKRIRFSLAIMLAALLAATITACSHRRVAAAQTQQKFQQLCKHNDLMKKYNCSIALIQSGATAGDADAEYALAYLYYYGIGTSEDDEAANTWMKKAAAQGQPLAMKSVALLKQNQSTSAVSNANLKNNKLKVHPPAKHMSSKLRAKNNTKSAKARYSVQRCDVGYGSVVPDAKALTSAYKGAYTLQLIASPKASLINSFIRNSN